MNQKIFSAVADDEELTPVEREKVERAIKQMFKELSVSKRTDKRNIALMAFGYNWKKLNIEPFKPNVIAAMIKICEKNGIETKIIHRRDQRPGYCELVVAS